MVRFNPRRRSLAIRGAMAMAMAAALSGCGLFKGQPPVTYELEAPAAAARLAGRTDAQILVPEATALDTLNSVRVVVSGGGKLSYYPDVQYPDRLPKVVQDKIVETFQVSRRAHAVGRPGEGLSIDYQLVTNIRAFEFSTSTMSARVSLYVQLLDDRNGRAVATKLFSATAPVKADTGEGVVAGLNDALSRVLMDLAAWTLAAI
ncbi:MAG: ABC-type transport auxiliary lipoprotein family protein [Bauldia sp.]